jgi:glyoxylase-like metal-dependent hydrolase (beta-lactamase superfamily II)
MGLESIDRTSWVEPGIFEVADGVYRIPLPLPQDGLRAVNAYAVLEPGGVTLIDSGWALLESERRLVDALGVVGVGLADVSQFLVTHAHRDHYTQAVVLRERFGMKVALGCGERPSLDTLVKEPVARELRRVEDLVRCGAANIVATLQASWQAEDFLIAQWQAPDAWLEGGDVLVVGERRLDAIATPGHTQGHLVFRDAAAGLLFAGDHILPHITPSIGFEPVPPHSALRDYLASLRLLLDLPDTQLLPAHGPVVPTTHSRVHELLAHHDLRLRDSLRAVNDGASTAMEAAGRLGWTRRNRTLDELGVFDQMLATIETDAHLKVLVATGALIVSSVDSVDYYAPAD